MIEKNKNGQKYNIMILCVNLNKKQQATKISDTWSVYYYIYICSINKNVYLFNLPVNTIIYALNIYSHLSNH